MRFAAIALSAALMATPVSAGDEIRFNPHDAALAEARAETRACVRDLVYEAVVVHRIKSRETIRSLSDGRCEPILWRQMVGHDREAYAETHKMVDAAIDDLESANPRTH